MALMEQHVEISTVESTETIEMYITAAQGYPAMERLVLGACETLDISLHLFLPETACRSEEARARGLADWGDLVADTLERGVELRLLLNDFDAVGGAAMHSKVWQRMEVLLRRLTDLRPELLTHLQIQVAHPGGETGPLLRTAVWPGVRRRALKALQEIGSDLRRAPGLSGLSDPQGRVKWWPPKRLFTQTLHQKFMVADNSHAIVGGLDIDERFFDDPDHRRDGHQTWHDVAAGVTGPVVRDLAAHFANSWNIVRERGVCHSAAFFTKDESDRFGPCFRSRPATLPSSIRTPTRLKALRTVALQSFNPIAFGPVNTVGELEAAYCAVINHARSLLYIETQFLRSSVIRDALIEAGRDKPGLHVIALLPGAPDDVAFKGKSSPVHRYGEWLQSRALDRIRKAYGARFAAFCLTNARPRQEKTERDALYDKAMVYVHAKVMFADDEIGVISSANLNGRSLQWDFEAGVLIDWPERVRTFRQRLWDVHLGGYDEDKDAVLHPGLAIETWTASAADRAAQKGEAPGCGVVPFPHAPTRRFAKRHFFLPENTV